MFTQRMSLPAHSLKIYNKKVFQMPAQAIDLNRDCSGSYIKKDEINKRHKQNRVYYLINIHKFN